MKGYAYISTLLLLYGNVAGTNFSLLESCYEDSGPTFDNEGLVNFRWNPAYKTLDGTQCTVYFHNPVLNGYVDFKLELVTSSCSNNLLISDVNLPSRDNPESTFLKFSPELDRTLSHKVIYNSSLDCARKHTMTKLIWYGRSYSRYIEIKTESDTEWNFNIRYKTDLDCGNKEFKCTTELACIPIVGYCDGHRDCADWTDEENCQDYLNCVGEGSMYCHKEGICLPQSNVCDGNIDCWETGEDEKDCKGAHLNIQKDPLWITAITLSVIVFIVIILVAIYQMKRHIKHRRYLKYRDMSMSDLLKAVEELT